MHQHRLILRVLAALVLVAGVIAVCAGTPILTVSR
jgi:hypothetical protein